MTRDSRKQIADSRSWVAGCSPSDEATQQPSNPATASSAIRYLLSAIYLLPAIPAWACPVCFGNPDSPLTKGTSNGILFLLAIIGLVQIGFIALFVTFWRRARAIRRRRESFHLIEGGAH